MKWVVAVLVIICAVESYLLYTSKKERDFFYLANLDMQKTDTSTAYYLALMHLKLAEDIRNNMTSAQNIANSLVCENPSIKNYVSNKNIPEEMRTNLEGAIVRANAYCRNIK